MNRFINMLQSLMCNHATNKIGNGMNRFPTDEEFGAIQSKYPTPELELIRQDIASEIKSNFGSENLESLFLSVEIDDWIIHLGNRMIQARDSYHLMMFYFDRGIPDERPWISPGKDGESISYFPDFQESDFSNMARFNFYADTFFSKLYSAFDSTGHLLKGIHQVNLPPKRVYFTTVVEELNKSGNSIGKELQVLVDNPEFEKLNSIRNDITHNFLPGMHGGSIQRSFSGKALKEITFGVGKYVKAIEIVSIANDSLKLFNSVLCAADLRSTLYKDKGEQ